MRNALADLGRLLRDRREELQQTQGRDFGLRQLAERLGVSAGYVSQVENAQVKSPPTEAVLTRWAAELGLSVDVVLALAGRISTDVREAIVRRPELFAELIRELNTLPDHAVLRLVREVRDGSW